MGIVDSPVYQFDLLMMMRVLFVLMPYRRRRGNDTWHFCRNCSNWPTSDYDERSDRPTTGEMCNECRAKDAAGNCSR